MKRILIFFLLFSPIIGGVKAQQGTATLTCVFYNLENLFHPSDDESAADDDFTESGTRHWNNYRYYKKITAICKVLLSTCKWSLPDIICLCEIENRQVLTDLLSHPLMLHTNYGILHRDSQDHRGMDVAMLYNRERLTCLDTTWIPFFSSSGEPLETREMVASRFRYGNDTIACTSVHWTSNYGGSYETGKIRLQQADRLAQYLDSLLKAQPGLIVIAGGDFNDYSNSEPLQKISTSCAMQELVPEGRYASYKYHGRWANIDHAFVGGKIQYKDFECHVFSPAFLLEMDEAYTGLKPFRTYSGYRYNGGISDHLPLVLTFDLGVQADH